MENTVKTTNNWPEIVAKKEDEITVAKARIAELEALVTYYEERFRLEQHRRFGPKSEKSQYDEGFTQPDIFNEAEATADASDGANADTVSESGETDAVSEPELREVQRHFRNRKRLVNDELPENIPVEIVEHDIAESEKDCPKCNGKLHLMGRGDKRRELVIIPAQVKIVEHVSKTYACRNCEQTDTSVPIVKSPLPAPVIKGSYASPEAIAYIMCQKFVMGAPLYRQEQDWNRQGIRITRQTMSNWIIAATEAWLVPVYDALRERLLRHSVLHADETTLQVLKEPGKPPQSKSYMWMYRTGSDADFPIVLYEYQPSREAKHPAAFLANFTGYLHADGYEGYHSLPGGVISDVLPSAKPATGRPVSSGIIVVGCFAHARRKFDEALKSLPAKARAGSQVAIGKDYCDRLFKLERDFAEAGLTAGQRYDARQEKSKPLLDEFFSWAQANSHMTKTPLGKAVHYALNQRQYLEHFLLDGRLELSNNRAERSIKPFVIDRKNFLFANTPRGATASAVMFSIIETAKENGLNPFKYLVCLFNQQAKSDPMLPHLIPSELKRKLG